MKKLASISVAILIMALALVSCKGDKAQLTEEKFAEKQAEQSSKKILHFIYHDEGITTEYKYDSQKRIISKETTYPESEDDNYQSTFTYNGENEVVIDSSTYTRNGNTITGRSTLTGYHTTLTLDNDGNIIKQVEVYSDGSSSEATYEYSGGNLIKSTEFGGEHISEYKYDDKHSAYNCNTPRWILQFYSFAFAHGASKNNVIQKTFNGDRPSVYNYTYDEDGYPQYVDWESGGGDCWSCSFEYFE